MISNLRISLVELVIWALLAMAGLVWMLARVFDGLERAAAWWRDRERGIDPPWWWKPWLYRRAVDYGEDEPLEPLPPERTWEQMTSHQLPMAFELKCPVELDGRLTAGEIADLQERYGAGRERRAPWWEAEHRAAYESLGFDYPSRLMARVREAAP